MVLDICHKNHIF